MGTASSDTTKMKAPVYDDHDGANCPTPEISNLWLGCFAVCVSSEVFVVGAMLPVSSGLQVLRPRSISATVLSITLTGSTFWDMAHFARLIILARLYIRNVLTGS